jgi:photosynthetic reaction center cytochrome c subunit
MMKKIMTTCIGLAAVSLLVACERPPVETTQIGLRGTAMVDVQNPRDPAGAMAYPAALPAASSAGPKAGEVYQNVQVLGDLSVGEFTRLMTAITAWVSPEQGCNYCHDPANLADDSMYTKVVSRRMIEMTQHINGDWTDHVAATGVNCYTCHRGLNVPEYIWFEEGDSTFGNSPFAGWRDGQNRPVAAVAYSTLPSDPFSKFLASPDQSAVRLASSGPFPESGGLTTKEAESHYALMMHYSSSLDVNCTYCHMTASFQNWEVSTPARAKAWYGQSMVRALNADYLTPLAPVYPDNRLGPHTGDAPKAYCATCHQGQKKPLGGASAVDAYPALAPD